MNSFTAPNGHVLNYYTDRQSPLQAYEIWLPRPIDESDPDKTIWLIYVHGGAWRDPEQTCSDAEATVNNLFPNPNIAGVISLNYRLSPYTSHPSNPSKPDDEDRNVVHPTHVQDVATGIRYVIKKYGIKRWIAMGHSCGATLLMQYVSRIGLSEHGEQAGKDGGLQLSPEALILTAGIYSVPLFLKNHTPPSCPPNISEIYQSIVTGAFGSVPLAPESPVSGSYDTKVWANGRLIVLAHSYADELVERQQRDVMCVALDRHGWGIVMEDGDEEGDVGEGKKVLEVRDIKGEHDFVWKDGVEGARLVKEAVDKLVAGS